MLLKPHVFAIANGSFKDMLLESQDQSILISGESGAGKTECTKQCLNFLADAAESEDNVEQRILQVLNAFLFVYFSRSPFLPLGKSCSGGVW